MPVTLTRLNIYWEWQVVLFQASSSCKQIKQNWFPCLFFIFFLLSAFSNLCNASEFGVSLCLNMFCSVKPASAWRVDHQSLLSHGSVRVKALCISPMKKVFRPIIRIGKGDPEQEEVQMQDQWSGHFLAVRFTVSAYCCCPEAPVGLSQGQAPA